MKKFEFSTKKNEDEVFSGQMFYNIYKHAEFLQYRENIETILSKGHELRNMLKQVKPGEQVAINGIMLEVNTPLFVKKTGPQILIENFEFTANRLSGLVAAYAFENRSRFSVLESTEANSLGLMWESGNEKKCRLYLSAVIGTEDFYDQFKFWPLLCALRKFQIKKVRKEVVIKIAKTKNPEGISMAQDLMNNFTIVKDLWTQFPSASGRDLIKQLELCPPELKALFIHQPRGLCNCFLNEHSSNN